MNAFRKLLLASATLVVFTGCDGYSYNVVSDAAYYAASIANDVGWYAWRLAYYL